MYIQKYAVLRTYGTFIQNYGILNDCCEARVILKLISIGGVYNNLVFVNFKVDLKTCFLNQFVNN